MVANEMHTGSEAVNNSHRSPDAEFCKTVTDAVLLSFERIDQIQERVTKLEREQTVRDMSEATSRRTAAVRSELTGQ